MKLQFSNTTKRVIQIVSIVIGLGLIFYFAARLIPWHKDYLASLERADVQMVEVQKDLTLQTALLDAARKELGTGDDGNTTWYSMGDAGTIVAAQQNALISTLRDDSLRYGDIKWDDKRYASVGEAMAPYLPTSMMYQWYAPDSLYLKNTTWVCKSVGQYSDEVFDTVWYCVNGDELLALALGIYHTDTGMFSDISIILTEAGVAKHAGEVVVPQPTEPVVTDVTESDVTVTEESQPGGFVPPVVEPEPSSTEVGANEG